MFNMNYYDTENEVPDDPLEPMPDLCHKCGKCCRSATTYHSYKVLQEKVAAGDQEAIDFLAIFKPYDSIEDARLVEPEQVAQVLDVVSKRDDMKVEEVTFYYCDYVSPEGLCTIYERRPRCCRTAPTNGWSAMPPGCGFEGWQFEQREKQKRMIRDLKTSAYLMEQLSPDGIHHPARPETTLEDLRILVTEKIKPWKAFGSHYW
jgi:Fe-S-cluster containining protein